MERIGVVGAGTMGAGIAQIAALGGLDVLLHDPDPEALAGAVARIEAGLGKGQARGRWSASEALAARNHIKPVDALQEMAGAECAIEAVPEDLKLKRDLFAVLAGVLGDRAILATNTSSLSVAEIAASTPHPERVVGLHFFNPAPLMRLVEVVATAQADPAALEAAARLARRMGREPIRVADSIGFLANRLARPFTLEALRVLEEGWAEVEEIDSAARRLAGFRMGPFELIDLVGVDVNYAVACSFWEASDHEPRWRPSPLQEALLAEGRLGRKSGRGFYEHGGPEHRPADPASEPNPGAVDPDSEDPGERALARMLAQIVNEAHFAVGEGVGSRGDADTAMKLGFNWPAGPFELAALIGRDRIAALLGRLCVDVDPLRYRLAPLLAGYSGQDQDAP